MAYEEIYQQYLDNLSEKIKMSEAMLPEAIALKSRPEWKAAEMIIESKIGVKLVELSMKPIDKVEYQQGFIGGMNYVIQLVNSDMDKAIEEKKKMLIRKSLDAQKK